MTSINTFVQVTHSKHGPASPLDSRHFYPSLHLILTLGWLKSISNSVYSQIEFRIRGHLLSSTTYIIFHCHDHPSSCASQKPGVIFNIPIILSPYIQSITSPIHFTSYVILPNPSLSSVFTTVTQLLYLDLINCYNVFLTLLSHPLCLSSNIRFTLQPVIACFILVLFF